MVDQERRNLIKGLGAAGATASTAGCLADIVLKEEDRKRKFGDRREDQKKPEDREERTDNVSDGVGVLEGIDDNDFEALVNEAEIYHQSYEDHQDIFEEVKWELEETPYTTEFQDYWSEQHENGRGVMVTEDVVLATTENQVIRREVNGDQRKYVVPEGVDAVIKGFPSLEEFLGRENVPSYVETETWREYVNDFGQIAPFVPETKYDQPNFAEEIIREFTAQKEELDEHVDRYKTILTGGRIDLGDRIVETEGLGQVLDDLFGLRDYIESASSTEVSENEYEKHSEEYVELSEAKELLEGGNRYFGVENTLQASNDLFDDVSGELAALATLSEVYGVAIQEMEEGAEIYEGGEYDSTGQPKEDKDDEYKKDKPDKKPDHDHDKPKDSKKKKDKGHKPPAGDKHEDGVTEPAYQKGCAKIKNADLYQMERDLSYEQVCELMEPVLEDIYGDGYNVDVFFDESFKDPGETGIIFLHYEENEASGEVRDAEVGYRMINEDGVSVPSKGEGSRFGPPVYGPYDMDEGLVEDVLNYVTVDMDCREY